MGVGRRMQKQGPPPDLGKKRKAFEAEGSAREKKRKTSEKVRPVVPSKKPLNRKKDSGLKQQAKGTFGNGKISKSASGKGSVKPTKAVLQADDNSDNDAADLLSGANLDEGIVGDDLEEELSRMVKPFKMTF